MSTRSIDSYLEENSVLLDISQQISRLAQINMLLKDLLPAELVENCSATHLEQGCLTLTASENATGMLLRYQAQSILSALRKTPALAGLTSIKTCVRPNEPLAVEVIQNAPKKAPATVTLSREASRSILEHAKNIPDQGIRHALEQLAKHYQEEKK